MTTPVATVAGITGLFSLTIFNMSLLVGFKKRIIFVSENDLEFVKPYNDNLI